MHVILKKNQLVGFLEHKTLLIHIDSSPLSVLLCYSTCQHGTWTCTKNICPGVCTIYGSGHYKTFDQQRFGFRGECSYIAAQVPPDKYFYFLCTFVVPMRHTTCYHSDTTAFSTILFFLLQINHFIQETAQGVA